MVYSDPVTSLPVALNWGRNEEVEYSRGELSVLSPGKLLAVVQEGNEHRRCVSSWILVFLGVLTNHCKFQYRHVYPTLVLSQGLNKN